MAAAPVLVDPAWSVLARARVAAQTVHDGEVALLRAAVEMVRACPPQHATDVAADRAVGGVGSAPDVPLHGEGAPAISTSAVAELGVAVGISTGRARRLVGDAVELSHRLPLLWRRVERGDVEVWLARQVARRTVTLSQDVAAYVDRHLAPFAHRLAVARIDALVTEALIRFDPAEHLSREAERADPRRFDVHLSDVTPGGMVPVEGTIDLPDAIALEQAVRGAACDLAGWGFAGTDDARRARALGEIARSSLSLTDQRPGPGAAAAGREPAAGADPSRPSAPTPDLMLYVHLAEPALVALLREPGEEPSATAGGDEHEALLARSENSRTSLHLTTLASWCRSAGARVVIRPVLDVAASIRVDSYEIPDRLREQVVLRDGTCVFPRCETAARSCDIDHIVPFDHEHPAAGGQTETSNLAALCRTHHNLKTHHGWSYDRDRSTGSYRWRSPHGLRRRTDDGVLGEPRAPD